MTDPDNRGWYERNRMLGASHPRAWRWAFAVAIVLGAVALASLVIPNVDRRAVTTVGRGVEFGAKSDATGRMDDPVARGTGGSDTDPGGGPGHAPAGTPWVELHTLSGREDLADMVGQRVSFAVPTPAALTEAAFWVGEGSNRLLVVPDRDRRSGIDRQMGGLAGHDSFRAAGDQVIVSGVIEPVPYAEATYSWNLTRHEVAELTRRGVYVRASGFSAAGPRR